MKKSSADQSGLDCINISRWFHLADKCQALKSFRTDVSIIVRTKKCYRCRCRRFYSDDITHITKREGRWWKRRCWEGVKTVGSTTPPNANVSFCECRNGSPIGNYWQFPYKRHRLGFALRHNGRLRTRRSRARTHTKRRLNRTDPKLNEFWAVINLTQTADPLPLWGKK